MLKIVAFFIIMLFAQSYGKHLHDRIIELRVEVWAYKTSLTSPLFINVPV